MTDLEIAICKATGKRVHFGDPTELYEVLEVGGCGYQRGFARLCKVGRPEWTATAWAISLMPEPDNDQTGG